MKNISKLNLENLKQNETKELRNFNQKLNFFSSYTFENYYIIFKKEINLYLKLFPI